MHKLSSPLDRAQETLKIAYKSATNKRISQKKIYENLLTDETVQKKKKGYSSYEERRDTYAKIEAEHTKDTEWTKQQSQKETATKFLRGEFETDDPFTISLHRLRVLRLLLRNADKNKKIKPYTIIGFRHGNKEGELLSQEGEEQAEKLGRDILKKEIKA